MLSGVGALGATGILLIVNAAQNRRHVGMYEKAGKDIDEKLKDSKAILDKATARIQSIFDHIKKP
jgi:hypothetical protein